MPHPFEHTCFKPRKEDYKPPVTCDDHDDELCVRKDHRTLTADEQNRFLNAFTQINAMNALGPLVDIHSNAIHQMHSNPRFLPWHRIYLLRMEELLMMVDPTVCIPYWKSSEEQAFPSWLLGFTPTVNLMQRASHGHSQHRRFAFLPNAAAVAAAMANGTFNTVRAGARGSAQLGACLGRRIDAKHSDRADATRCSGCTTPRSIASGPNGRRPIPARIPSWPAPRHHGSVDRDRSRHARHHGSRYTYV